MSSIEVYKLDNQLNTPEEKRFIGMKEFGDKFKQVLTSNPVPPYRRAVIQTLDYMITHTVNNARVYDVQYQVKLGSNTRDYHIELWKGGNKRRYALFNKVHGAGNNPHVGFMVLEMHKDDFFRTPNQDFRVFSMGVNVPRRAEQTDVWDYVRNQTLPDTRLQNAGGQQIDDDDRADYLVASLTFSRCA